MGCWDITCALTNLPIREGDPVRWFFLRQPMYWDMGWSHPWAQWIPLSFPIQGVYNNYGGIEGWKEGNLLQFQVECFRKYALREAPSPNERFLDAGDDAFPNTMESLLSTCERGFLKLEFPSDEDSLRKTKKVSVSSFVVHEEIYQRMIAPIDGSPPGIGVSHERLKRETGRSRTEMLQMALRCAQDDETWQESADPALQEELGASPFQGMSGLSLLLLARELTSNFESTPDVLVVGNGDSLSLEDWPVLRKFTDEDWKELDQKLLEQETFWWAMKELRREFFPARFTDQYSYSQNTLDAHRLFLRFVDEMAHRIQKDEEALLEEE